VHQWSEEHVSAKRTQEGDGKRTHERAHENTSKSVDIYTALRDPKTGIVRLFIEYYPKHPSEKAEGEPELPMAEVFMGCMFSNFRNFSGNTVEVQAETVSKPLSSPSHAACGSLQPACGSSCKIRDEFGQYGCCVKFNSPFSFITLWHRQACYGTAKTSVMGLIMQYWTAKVSSCPVGSGD